MRRVIMRERIADQPGIGPLDLVGGRRRLYAIGGTTEDAMTMRRVLMLAVSLAALMWTPAAVTVRGSGERHFLYVAEPGIRNYVEYGGIGVLVFDMDHGYRFVRRIPTFDVPEGEEPENVKGVAADARSGRLYVTTIKRLAAFDLATDKLVWNRTYEGGCDRLAVSPDGSLLYVPSLEGPHWHVIDAKTGDVIAKIVPNSGAHNTIYGPDGTRVYLAGLRSPVLSIADPATHTIVASVGPFDNVIRPFTINHAQTLCFVNVNDLLGFEVGDIRTGKMLHRVEVAGFSKGPVKRHGCPSHGIGLTPDERELWLADGANSQLHVFDATVMPPKQVASIAVRDQPGWITFSLDGREAFPSTGEIIDTETRKVVATLQDEAGRAVQSEKVVEVVFDGDKVARTGDQFGVGRK
jgi:DNA-binding beta-propeller fold protein YncE